MQHSMYQENKDDVHCLFESGSRKGLCVECLAYHRRRGEVPLCFLPDDSDLSTRLSPQYHDAMKFLHDFC